MEVTPAQAAIIKQTVEALFRACASHQASSSGGAEADASRASDAGCALDTFEGARGNCLF